MSMVAMLAGLLGLISAVLIMHCQYEDGLIGRIALGAVVLAAVVIVGSELDGARYNVPREVLLLLGGLAAFELRHLYRFLRWVSDGTFGWRRRQRGCVSVGMLPWLAMFAAAALLLPGCASVLVVPSSTVNFPNGDSITRQFSPCTDQRVIAFVPPQYRPRLQAGSGIYEGKPYALCWLTEQKTVVIIWEDGGIGYVPLGMFDGERPEFQERRGRRVAV